MPEHPSNHDRFIKQVLGRPDLAAAFFARTLPSAIVESVRLDELKLVESGFVDAELQESFSDMLFEVPAQDGKRIAFALLFEHKATQDRRTAVQILGYLAHVYRKQTTFIPVIPFLFYQGRDGHWKLGQSFAEMLSFSEDQLRLLGNYLPNFAVRLFDLKRENLDQFRSAVELVAMLTTMREIWSQTLDFLPAVVDLLLQVPEAEKRVESARTLLIYLSYSRKEDFGELKAPLERSGAMELREAIMTAAEQLKQEGKAEGRLEGRLEGKLEGKLEDARRMEEEGMELRLIAKITGLTTDELLDNGIGRN